MARLIDADQAVAEADRLFNMYNLAMAGAETNREINHVLKRQELFKAVRAVLNTCPTAIYPSHGRWLQISVPNERNEILYQCSICDYIDIAPADGTHNYCAKCGAKMDGNGK